MEDIKDSGDLKKNYNNLIMFKRRKIGHLVTVEKLRFNMQEN